LPQRFKRGPAIGCDPVPAQSDAITDGVLVGMHPLN
jgi:hypothetical protein